MTAAHPFISLENVSLLLHGKLIFENTTWHILDDQHWAILGPNGSGKSTLMKALCGQIPVVQGKITYHFAPSRALPHQDVAYVSFQEPEKRLHRHARFHQARWNLGPRNREQSVSEYLSSSSRLNPFQVLSHAPDQAKIATKCDRVASMLAIEPLLPKPWIQLSDGERRKVSLAQALLQEPRLLILDNPFTGLDERFRHRLTQVLQRLVRDRTQIMVVVSRHSEIPSIITHTLSIREQSVVTQGPSTQAVPTEHTTDVWSLASAPPSSDAIKSSSANGHALVRMKGINVSYNGDKILHDVNWTIHPDQHWALLGPNGAGKSTLLGLILGDHPQAYANDIVLFGKQKGEGESIWEIKQQIGWVSPELHLYYPKHLSCLDIVCSGYFDSVGLYAQCTDAQRRQARAKMDYLHLSNRAHTPFAQLSEGEQRLVLIARAIVKEPRLLILDEPCQGLDDVNRRQTLRAISDIGHRFDTTVIYVTHDVNQLPSLITHVMMLDQGRVTNQGKLDQVPKPAYGKP